ncbi:MAG: NB-ARC domain-containing protein, partial [Dolichospermum sp.]
MTKSVIIDLGLGNLEQNTPVRVKLWWNSDQRRPDEYQANLPPDPILSRIYKIWQRLYDIHYYTVSSRSSVTLLVKKPTQTYIRRCPQWDFQDLWDNINNLSDHLHDNNLLQQLDDFINLDGGLLDLCENVDASDINENLALAQQKLEQHFNIWLQCQEFVNCRSQWDKNEFLDVNDEIFVILQIQDHLIRKLPWHQWDFFTKYPLATHGFGSLSYQGRFVGSKLSNQVQILAVLCDDEGIDLQQERSIFQQLVNGLDAKIDFMPFPFDRKQLEQRLEKGCDVLFFAGHSKTQGESGHIYINDKESLTINDLNNALEMAIDQGLRLAIFNSCDGLGLASDLAKLNISNMIVMKEQVSNFIAQEFFRYFLEFFAQEKYPVFLAVQEARNKLKQHELQHPGASFLPALCTNPAVVEPLTWENLRDVNPQSFYSDWGNVPPVNHFFGRTQELQKLKQWIINERCRVLAIVGSGGIGKTGLSVKLGQGGIGKTDLSVKLARGIQGEFDYIIWRSLLNAPPFTEIITDIIKFLSHQQETSLSASPNLQIERFITYLQKHRCLVILDNVESILVDGKYRNGYSDYGQMLQQLQQQKHQSCVLLTSRVIPPEIESRRYKDGAVSLLELTGLREMEAVKKIFNQIGEFTATDEDWEKLIEVYGGNPLFLELSAGFIKDKYKGDIAAFLDQEQHLLATSMEDDLLNWHFQRLNPAEKEIIYWLAINREPVSASELLEDVLSTSKLQLENNIQSLKRKIPLEIIVESSTEYKYTLQPVLIEYITKQFINQIIEEIRANQPQLFITHALLKAQGKEFIKNIQIRLILQPIIEQLIPESEFIN